MKSLFFVFPVIMLTGCSVQRAMDRNQRAIQRSSDAIERNVEALNKLTDNLEKMQKESS